MYFHSLTPIIPLLAALAPTTSAHGSHAPPVLNAEGIDDRNYMQKHVSTLPRLPGDLLVICGERYLEVIADETVLVLTIAVVGTRGTSSDGFRYRVVLPVRHLSPAPLFSFNL